MTQTVEIPAEIVERARSCFLFWCDECRQAFQPKRGAQGLPYNGIQHIICHDCMRKLRK
jgi:hypothetical protein